MKDWRSQAHVKWTCKYHVVIVPKYRRRKFYGSLRGKVGQILRELCQQKGVELLEGKAMPDHLHLLLSIPPKYSVAQVIGFIKGKSAIHIARTYVGRRKSFTGYHFWARGYFVSTVGANGAMS